MKKYNFIFLLGFMLSILSCDIMGSLDDIEPLNKLEEEQAFTDNIKVEAALNGVYATWRKASGGYLPGNIMALSGNYSRNYNTAFNENNIDYSNSDIRDAYLGYYELVQRANFLIDALKSDQPITGMTDLRRVEVEAEARITRAMSHLFLLEIFGQFYDINSTYGVVLKMTASRELENPKRNTVQEVYDGILEDLDFAIVNAPDFAPHYKMSKSVAQAFKAKTLLYMGLYDQAAENALAVINGFNYPLEANYSDIFTNGYNSQEVLFAPLSIAYTESVPVNISNYFSPLAIEQVADQEAEDDVSGTMYDKRYTFAHIDGVPQGLRNAKYPYNSSTEGQQSNTHFIMRTAEVYLIFAEAKARLAAGTTVDSEALDMLNEIRTRANVPTKSPMTKKALLEDIRIEKNLELFGEFGQPWFDMIRYHMLGDIDISLIKSSIVSIDQLTMPIPKAAFAGNNALIQNPGYSN
ncbi:RagB/SusD family nutrient uptake outer membrane protein [Ancylomarina euxinus]|uniref:RagB/SusD family nutrient uptake outer membrane protein n=1 Tax=Ancylomarina euxinus TaxID=2283627 RepID=A0A425XZ23_9BACT|nr:RagB/SusD family nutrient uptake outer membrane protein [Ancylomarina euxinus]MCZ4695591.1 RagB/SusD family nutrient uptake outer membrane protein [Ancylomarina euxinus]MUP15972.1 RagB/SusD family nutrient uptake outer membrane protein [Ancylomarina euxinus]RRG20414.1 RagB/SusD family nutrient uptake outer membrane protein [Ancylomarina euxinus]